MQITLPLNVKEQSSYHILEMQLKLFPTVQIS